MKNRQHGQRPAEPQIASFCELSLVTNADHLKEVLGNLLAKSILSDLNGIFGNGQIVAIQNTSERIVREVLVSLTDHHELGSEEWLTVIDGEKTLAQRLASYVSTLLENSGKPHMAEVERERISATLSALCGHVRTGCLPKFQTTPPRRRWLARFNLLFF